MSDEIRIILLSSPGKAQNVDVGYQLRDWLKGRATVIADNLDKPLDVSALPRADFIITLGGDGTILSTVRTLGEKQMPIIGVNMGKLGFLAEFSFEELKEQFDQIIRTPGDKKPYVERIMLECKITGPNRDEFQTKVVNEVAIVAGPPFRMIEVSVSISEENLALCAGDGLIVATPTGSTAYNLSAGGPILAGTLRSAVITPLAAHSLSFRPIVVGLDKPITLRCRDHQYTKVEEVATDSERANTAVVVIDGQVNVPLQSEDQVIITHCPSVFMLVPNSRHSQWHLLNAKLHWGALPNYNLP